MKKKRRAFISFDKIDSANLALYALGKTRFNGAFLKIDYAFPKKDEDKKDKKESPLSGSTVSGANSDPNKPRIIPGLVTKPKANEEASPSSSQQSRNKVDKESSPNSSSTPSSPSQDPQVEITIRNTTDGEILYQFRPQNIQNIKNLLISEGASASDVFQVSVPPKSQQITYGGNSVVHLYPDSLGVEFLESNEFSHQRKNDFQSYTKKHSPQLLNKPKSLENLKIPVEQLHQTLQSKGYNKVILNLDPNGPLAPLSPSWKVSNLYGFKKGNTIVAGEVAQNGKGAFLKSVSFVRSNSGTFKDLVDFIKKYNLCIINIDSLTVLDFSTQSNQ